MKALPSKVLCKDTIAEWTIACRLSRPDGFQFRAGQAIDVLLPADMELANGDCQRTFSIASAPHEPDLLVATRLRSTDFKFALDRVERGQNLAITPPGGSFQLHSKEERPAVMIAGGIGITPFLSMLRSLKYAGSSRRVVLLFSNRRPEDAPFLKELTCFEKDLPGYTFVPTMTEMERSRRTWDGETRRISAELIEECCAGLEAPVFYVVGPPAMAEDVRVALAQTGVDSDDVRSDDFFGY